MTRLYRSAFIVGGAGVIALGLIAQVSSVLTPELARYPLLVTLFGSLGGDLLFLSAVLFGWLSLRKRRRVYTVIAGVSLLGWLIVELTLWGTVFQLSLAGLTVGGSMILLGCL
ncbi:hypothetical protein KGQ71_00085 [Patescibacteria group bacterium]|nr:hypothetical protein [Patescibacteria group bacterium]